MTDLKGIVLTTRYGFLSTYPPTLCGLATFTSALRTELVPSGDYGPVVRAVEGIEQPGSQEIAADLVAGDLLSVYRAASVLNDTPSFSTSTECMEARTATSC
jgi:hypothetical protein